MPKIIQDISSYRAERAWGATQLAEIDTASARLHWTDQPYKWHRNQGEEVFVVLEGEVNMHYREEGLEKVANLKPSDIFVAHEGEEHVAHPVGEARILVVERSGSV